jgi:hypothetical protein
MTTGSCLSRPIPHTQLARYLRVSPAWLAAELEAGRLPGVNAGDRWLCDVDTIQRLITERAQRPPEQSKVGCASAAPPTAADTSRGSPRSGPSGSRRKRGGSP